MPNGGRGSSEVAEARGFRRARPDDAIERIATKWVQSFILDPTANPDYQVDAYRAAHQALSELRMVSQDVLKTGRELLFFCVGIEMSWPGWYHQS